MQLTIPRELTCGIIQNSSFELSLMVAFTPSGDGTSCICMSVTRRASGKDLGLKYPGRNYSLTSSITTWIRATKVADKTSFRDIRLNCLNRFSAEVHSMNRK